MFQSHVFRVQLVLSRLREAQQHAAVPLKLETLVVRKTYNMQEVLRYRLITFPGNTIYWRNVGPMYVNV